MLAARHGTEHVAPHGQATASSVCSGGDSHAGTLYAASVRSRHRVPFWTATWVTEDAVHQTLDSRLERHGAAMVLPLSGAGILPRPRSCGKMTSTAISLMQCVAGVFAIIDNLRAFRHSAPPESRGQHGSGAGLNVALQQRREEGVNELALVVLIISLVDGCIKVAIWLVNFISWFVNSIPSKWRQRREKSQRLLKRRKRPHRRKRR